MNRVLWLHVGVAAAAIAASWALTSGGGARLKAQLSFAAGSAEPDPGADSPIKTGMSPGPYGSPCSTVPGAHRGPHPLKRHPKGCSPYMNAVIANQNEWMFCPPSEDDL